MRIQCLGNFVGIYYQISGQARNLVSAAQLIFFFLFCRQGRTDIYFHRLGGLLSDNKRVFPFDVLHNGLVKFIAGYPQTGPGHNRSQRDYRNFGSTAANVDNHISGKGIDGNASAQSGQNRLLYDIGLFGACLAGGIYNRAFFVWRNSGWH